MNKCNKFLFTIEKDIIANIPRATFIFALSNNI